MQQMKSWEQTIIRPRRAGGGPYGPGKRQIFRLWQFWVSAGVLLILLALLIVSLAARRGGEAGQETYYPSRIGALPVVTDLLPEDALNRPGIPRRVEWIVIHETGNSAQDADAQAHNTYIHSISQETELSWHYTVDETMAYHHVPDNEVAWHAGDKLTGHGGNKNGIGIEICVNEGADFEAALDNAELLTGYLMARYGLTEKQIRQHGDFISKNCPETIRGQERMAEFVVRASQYKEQILSGQLEYEDTQAPG